MKKIYTIFLTICICITSIIAHGIMNSDMVKAASVKKAAISSYKKMLMKELGGASQSFCIYDVNHDGTPELIFNNSLINASLYTYYGGKAVEVSSVHSGHGGFGFYQKGSVYFAGTLNHGIESSGYFKIVKGKAKCVASFYDDSASEMENASGPEYEIGGKKVSKAKYDTYIKKVTKKSKRYDYEMHELTKSNIQKYCR